MKDKCKDTWKMEVNERKTRGRQINKIRGKESKNV
jgi:hypothetical protein